MADFWRELKVKFSGSRARSPRPRPSINQSGPNATITIQGSYNDVGRDQITYITNLGGTVSIIQSKQNLTRLCITTGHDLVRLHWVLISSDVTSLIVVLIL